MLPVLTSPRGRILGGALIPVGPVVSRFRTSGRTDELEDAAETLREDGPFCEPAGIENPTTDEVGRRDLDDDA